MYKSCFDAHKDGREKNVFRKLLRDNCGLHGNKIIQLATKLLLIG